jgi:hypothetical protein
MRSSGPRWVNLVLASIAFAVLALLAFAIITYIAVPPGATPR